MSKEMGQGPQALAGEGQYLPWPAGVTQRQAQETPRDCAETLRDRAETGVPFPVGPSWTGGAVAGSQPVDLPLEKAAGIGFCPELGSGAVQTPRRGQHQGPRLTRKDTEVPRNQSLAGGHVATERQAPRVICIRILGAVLRHSLRGQTFERRPETLPLWKRYGWSQSP